MISKYELVGIAERLYKINREDGIYGYVPSDKLIQMPPEALVRLFPGEEFSERHSEHFNKGDVQYSAVFAGVKFMALCTPEELEKAKEAEKGIDKSNNI